MFCELFISSTVYMIGYGSFCRTREFDIGCILFWFSISYFLKWAVVTMVLFVLCLELLFSSPESLWLFCNKIFRAYHTDFINFVVVVWLSVSFLNVYKKVWFQHKLKEKNGINKKPFDINKINTNPLTQIPLFFCWWRWIQSYLTFFSAETLYSAALSG